MSEGPPDQPFSLASLLALEKELVAAERNPEIYGIAAIWRRPPEGAAARQRNTADATVRQELRLLFRAEYYQKPALSLLDGPVSGFELGFSLCGTHRVGTASCRLDFSGVADGTLPGPGLIYRLARLPAQIGTYLGLTGEPLDARDALSLGLLTHRADPPDFQRIRSALSNAEPIDQILDALPVPQAKGALTAQRETIASCFAGERLADIVERLSCVQGPSQAFAQMARAKLRALPLPAAELLLHALRTKQSFAECLRLDLAAADLAADPNRVTEVFQQSTTLLLDLPPVAAEPPPIA